MKVCRGVPCRCVRLPEDAERSAGQGAGREHVVVQEVHRRVPQAGLPGDHQTL